jgi:hypothetical protein
MLLNKGNVIFAMSVNYAAGTAAFRSSTSVAAPASASASASASVAASASASATASASASVSASVAASASASASVSAARPHPVLTDAGIAFIVVGGAAAVLQGVPITTMDLDIVHRRTPENVLRIRP